MISITDKTKCCGCGACENICPKKAIKMSEDEYGFKYPAIDEDLCVKCGLCEKVCPILNSTQNENDVFAYACYNKNENERKNSSSGGIFVLLAKEILKINGVVYGAALDGDFNVRHIKVEDEKDLIKIMGSKYVQSIIGNTYQEIKELLSKDRFVLFTGTPCQIEGLKSYLGRDYDKLYTQDIICHGVPSPRVWEKYKEYRKKIDGEIPLNISFRNKDNGWSLFNMKFTYEKKSYHMNQNEDLFMQAFLKNTVLRDSCYNCNFKKENRVSDITLADYWGIQQEHNDMYDNKGTSLVIVNSKKGKELFELIKGKLIYKETNLEKALQYNPSMIKSAEKDKNRKKFFENLDSLPFDELVKKYTYKSNMISKIVGKIKRIVKKIIKK